MDLALVYHFLAYSFCPVVEPLPVSCWFCSSPKRLRSIHHQVPYISIYVKKVEVEAVLTLFRETQTIISCVNKTYLEKYIWDRVGIKYYHQVAPVFISPGDKNEDRKKEDSQNYWSSLCFISYTPRIYLFWAGKFRCG